MTVIQIEKTTKASEIMAAFSNQFPYLKIEFFKKLITFERSLKKNFIKDDFIIKTEKNIKFITFEEATLVSELKNQFYKNFNLDNRAVVSATLLDFSDPSLKNERLTNFKYEPIPKGKISIRESLLETNYGNAFEIIRELLVLDNGKIVVAFNEVDAIIILANYLVEQKLIGYNEIAVLCGNSPDNKKRTAMFNSTVITNSIYPCKLNFLTSETQFSLNIISVLFEIF